MSLEQLQEYRKEAAEKMYKEGHVTKITDEHYIVGSQTQVAVIYDVYVVHNKWFVCNCEDFNKRSKNLKCKHELSVELFIKNNN